MSWSGGRTTLVILYHTAGKITPPPPPKDAFWYHAIFPLFVEISVKIQRPKRCAVCAVGLFFSAFFFLLPRTRAPVRARAGGSGIKKVIYLKATIKGLYVLLYSRNYVFFGAGIMILTLDIREACLVRGYLLD